MKKNVKNRKPNSRLKSKRYSKKKVKQPQILGIGPKIINSILIGLNEGDFIHVRKIVDGLDEYELASLIESLSLHDRQKLVEVLGDRINPEVFPELNEVVQEQSAVSRIKISGSVFFKLSGGFRRAYHGARVCQHA